jgi:nuclear pore complex protein Nup205
MRVIVDSTRSPSLTTLSSCLSSTGKQLTMIIAEFNSLCAQKENVASLKYEEIQEIAHTAIPKELGIKFDSLNPMQQTQVLIAEIDLRREQKMKELRSLVYTIENAIFILWRHLEFYLSRDSISKSTTFSPCERYANEKVVLLQQSLFQTSPVVIQQLKEACQHTMEPILQKLESIILPSSSLQDTALSVLYKRLRKCYQS